MQRKARSPRGRRPRSNSCRSFALTCDEVVMIRVAAPLFEANHSHVFLGEGHASAERQAWAVIWLCGAMMVLEVVGGLLVGSIALVADGLHMSTHASALLLAALAYSYAR